MRSPRGLLRGLLSPLSRIAVSEAICGRRARSELGVEVEPTRLIRRAQPTNHHPLRPLPGSAPAAVLGSYTLMAEASMPAQPAQPVASSSGVDGPTVCIDLSSSSRAPTPGPSSPAPASSASGVTKLRNALSGVDLEVEAGTGAGTSMWDLLGPERSSAGPSQLKPTKPPPSQAGTGYTVRVYGVSQAAS